MLRLAVVLLLLAMPAGAGAAVQDSLAAARDLYTTADYREALAMLTRLRPAATTPADTRAIDQYRAFALFALGQTAEAELVVEGIAGIDPTWTLPAGEAPPRLATLFAQARERALPGVLRQRLAAARALYSEKRYDASAEAFTAVLLLLEDPAMAKAAGADLQSMTALATGFRDLVARRRRTGPRRRRPSAGGPAPTPMAAATPARPSGAAAGRRPRPSEPAPAPTRAAAGSTDTPATGAATEPPPGAEPDRHRAAGGHRAGAAARDRRHRAARRPADDPARHRDRRDRARRAGRGPPLGEPPLRGPARWPRRAAGATRRRPRRAGR